MDNLKIKEKQLREQEIQMGKIQKVIDPLKQSIRRLQEDIRSEKNRRYSNKYYVYRNSNGNESWNLYVKSFEPKGYDVDVLTAQKYGDVIEIRRESGGEHLFQHEISKEEFDEAYKNLLKEVNKKKEK